MSVKVMLCLILAAFELRAELGAWFGNWTEK